jgi:hypothetical protein
MPGWIAGYVRWISDFPAHAVWLWHRVAALWWPWLPLAVLAVVLGTVALRLARRAAWRRAVAGGYWLAVRPPRTVDPGRWAGVWALLRPLAVRAGGRGWRLARPPLGFEVYGAGRELRVGLRLPGWIRPDAAEDIVTRAWPGAVVTVADPPALSGAVAGVALTPDPSCPDTGWLVEDTRPRAGTRRNGGTDAELGAVFAALGTPEAVTLLQVLIRPATSRRLRHLRMAGKRPVKPLRLGWQRGLDALLWIVERPLRLLVAVFDWWRPSAAGSSGTSRREPPTPEQRDAMSEARRKLAAGRHMLVSIRVGAGSARRPDASEAARSAGDSYAATARLRVVRLRRPAAVLAARWASASGWMLVTPAELGMLAHLPPDPGLYSFDTAALHRAHPGGVFHAPPERAGPTQPGWNRDRWTRPPTTTATDHDGDPPHDRHTRHDGHTRHDPAAGVPAPRSTPYIAAGDEDSDYPDSDYPDSDCEEGDEWIDTDDAD